MNVQVGPATKQTYHLIRPSNSASVTNKPVRTSRNAAAELEVDADAVAAASLLTREARDEDERTHGGER